MADLLQPGESAISIQNIMPGGVESAVSKSPLPEARHRSRSPSPAPAAVDLSPANSPPEPPFIAPAVKPDENYAYPFPMKLFAGETPEEAQSAEQYFLDGIDPDPGIESMLARTIIDQTRELNQLDRSRAQIIKLSLGGTLVGLLEPTITKGDTLGDPHKLKRIVNNWIYGGADAEKDLRKQLALAGLRLEDIVARGYALSIETLNGLDAMIDRAERRRDRSIRTLESSRALRSLVSLRQVQMRRAHRALTVDSARSEEEGPARDKGHDD